jgi:hypothetical protein
MYIDVPAPPSVRRYTDPTGAVTTDSGDPLPDVMIGPTLHLICSPAATDSMIIALPPESKMDTCPPDVLTPTVTAEPVEFSNKSDCCCSDVVLEVLDVSTTVIPFPSTREALLALVLVTLSASPSIKSILIAPPLVTLNLAVLHPDPPARI